jgi:hypothetical protein
LKELKNMTQQCGITSEENFWNMAAKSSERGSSAVLPSTGPQYGASIS